MLPLFYEFRALALQIDNAYAIASKVAMWVFSRRVFTIYYFPSQRLVLLLVRSVSSNESALFVAGTINAARHHNRLPTSRDDGYHGR